VNVLTSRHVAASSSFTVSSLLVAARYRPDGWNATAVSAPPPEGGGFGVTD
jgi:hypothetical protein